MLQIRKMLVSPSKYALKCPNQMTAQYITVHNTANDASANNEISYMINNNLSTSYHFAIDDKEIVQGIPVDRNAWHCGDGAGGTGNRKSIGVEICYSKSGGEKYQQAERLTIKLIAQLLHERGWEVDRVVTHQHWSKKFCPHRILNEGRWGQFLSQLQAELTKLQHPNYPKVTITFANKTVQGYLIDGQTFVKIRDLATLLGAQIGYDAASRTTTFNHQVVSGILIDNYTYLHVREAAKIASLNVNWDQTNRTVILSK